MTASSHCCLAVFFMGWNQQIWLLATVQHLASDKDTGESLAGLKSDMLVAALKRSINCKWILWLNPAPWAQNHMSGCQRVIYTAAHLFMSDPPDWSVDGSFYRKILGNRQSSCCWVVEAANNVLLLTISNFQMLRFTPAAKHDPNIRPGCDTYCKILSPF